MHIDLRRWELWANGILGSEMKPDVEGRFVLLNDVKPLLDRLEQQTELIDDMRCELFDIRGNVCEDEGRRIDELIKRAESEMESK